MNDINELIQLIGNLGGSATTDEITEAYCKGYHMVVQSMHKNMIQVVLADNGDVVSMNPDTYRQTPAKKPVTAPAVHFKHLIEVVDILREEFPQIEINDHDINGKLNPKARWLYPEAMERRGNVFMEIWWHSMQNKFDTSQRFNDRRTYTETTCKQ